MREESKKITKVINTCLDCFIAKGLTATTTKDLCDALGVCNGAIYYYFKTKEEIVLACAEESINRIEQKTFTFVLENLKDIADTMNRLSELADELSPVMRFFVSVSVSDEYGEKVKPYLVKLSERYSCYAEKIADILGCTVADVEPYVYLSILAINNYMIFNERALFQPQLESAKRGLFKLINNETPKG